YAEVRLQALCVLDGLGKATPVQVRRALADSHPGVRRHAVRVAEKLLAGDGQLGAALVPLTGDDDAQVRLQLAYSLGAWRHRARQALARLVLHPGNDPHLLAAVLSSVQRDNLATLLASVLAHQPPSETLVNRFLGMAVALGDRQSLASLLAKITTPKDGRFASWQLSALAGFVESLDVRKKSVDDLPSESVRQRLRQMLESARIIAVSSKSTAADRLAAIGMLGRDPARLTNDLPLLWKLL